MDFFQGERVRCLGKADWGSGIIAADSRDGKVCVIFLGAGRKVLSLKHAKLIKVKPAPHPAESASPIERVKH